MRVKFTCERSQNISQEGGGGPRGNLVFQRARCQLSVILICEFKKKSTITFSVNCKSNFNAVKLDNEKTKKRIHLRPKRL